MVPVCVADKHYSQIISITTEIGEEMNKKPFWLLTIPIINQELKAFVWLKQSLLYLS